MAEAMDLNTIGAEYRMLLGWVLVNLPNDAMLTALAAAREKVAHIGRDVRRQNDLGLLTESEYSEAWWQLQGWRDIMWDIEELSGCFDPRKFTEEF